MQTTYDRIPTRISPDILDTIGRSFKFKHGKGVAEWLKNSLDNYLRLRNQGKELRKGAWPVFINLVDGNSQKNGPNLAVIDFGGTSFQNVEDFFLHWGDKTAATLGGSASAAVTGGHGNGGKFYMREMWRDGARFSTWRDGVGTSLVVDRSQDGTTGFWEMKDHRGDWRQALRLSLPDSENLGGIDWLVQYLERNEPALLAELDELQRGFTVVAGKRAIQLLSSNDVVRGGHWDSQRLVDDIHDAPQARRPIRELAISIFVNGNLRIERLSPQTIEEDPAWPSQDAAIPPSIFAGLVKSEGTTSPGLLRVRKSANQLTGRQKYENSIFVSDSTGNPIAWYPLRELPLPGHSPILSFLQGDVQLSIPGIEDLVQNDRERLITNSTTEALLDWIGEVLWMRATEVESRQRESERRSDLQIATILNDALNQHAKQFLQELQTSLLVDLIDDSSGGGAGDSGSGIGPIGDGVGGEGPRTKGRGGNEGEGGTTEVPGITQPGRRPRYPQVLLSGIDADPSKDDGTSKYLTDRHPPLDQDDVDRKFGVWWINTEHPFANAAMDYGGPKGAAFKSHQLSMFRDVVQREGLRILQRRERELDLDRVENELSEITNRFLAELPHDLISELMG